MSPRSIGPFDVLPIGLGCMNLSHAYATPPPPEAAERLLLEALERGVTLFDTAALYGFGANETLVGRVLKPHRHRIVLCSKGGLTGQPVGPGGALQRVIDGRPEALRRDCETSLCRLQTDVIDLYYLHRWDKSVPIEDSVGALAGLVREGMVRRRSRSARLVTSRSAPPRKPRASGLKATKAAPISRQASSTAISGLRVHSEYSVCTAAIGCTAWARRSVAADTSDRPSARTLPSSTRRDIAPTESSIGTWFFRSTRCR